MVTGAGLRQATARQGSVLGGLHHEYLLVTEAA
jgi:hypothetical protein